MAEAPPPGAFPPSETPMPICVPVESPACSAIGGGCNGVGCAPYDPIGDVHVGEPTSAWPPPTTTPPPHEGGAVACMRPSPGCGGMGTAIAVPASPAGGGTNGV